MKKTKIIHRNPWWDYKHDKFNSKIDGEVNYFYGDSNGNSLIIATTKENKILLIQQKRYLKKNKISIEFPSGWINRNETAKQAALREMEEETCHQTKKISFIKKIETLPGSFKNTCHIFHAENVQKIKNCEIADKKITGVLYCTPKQIEELIIKDKIWAGQSIAAWHIFRQKVKKEKSK